MVANADAGCHSDPCTASPSSVTITILCCCTCPGVILCNLTILINDTLFIPSLLPGSSWRYSIRFLRRFHSFNITFWLMDRAHRMTSFAIDRTVRGGIVFRWARRVIKIQPFQLTFILVVRLVLVVIGRVGSWRAFMPLMH
jgi:hypothetical protein